MNSLEVSLLVTDAIRKESFSLSFGNILCECSIEQNTALRDSNKMSILFTGDSSNDDFEKCFIYVYQILFFNFGYFPEIISGFIPQLSCYQTAQKNHGGFFRSEKPFFNKLSHLLCGKTLDNYKQLQTSSKVKMEPIIQGFFYLFSHDYLNTLIEHKTILLLHILEGYGWHMGYKDGNGGIDYAVKHIIKKCFKILPEHKRHHPIYINDATKQAIQKNIEPLMQQFFSESYHDGLRNIRNYYSHFGKQNNYQRGDKLLFLFVVISLSFRVRILNDIMYPIPFSLEECEHIKESFLCIADYAHKEILETKNYTPQSTRYSNNEELECLIQGLQHECSM